MLQLVLYKAMTRSSISKILKECEKLSSLTPKYTSEHSTKEIEQEEETQKGNPIPKPSSSSPHSPEAAKALA